MPKIDPSLSYNILIEELGELLEEGRHQASQIINHVLVQTYWSIGKRIVEFEQNGQARAKYGSQLLLRLSKDLKSRFGRGFSRARIAYMRLFYIEYPICTTLSRKLSWSHYIEFLKIENPTERYFYEQQCIKDKWSVRVLKRQINSGLYERVLLSKNKQKLISDSQEESQSKQELEPQDIIKDPYVLEFLGLSPNEGFSEKDLEQRIVDNLQAFLLELGSGFTFVQRQFRISLGGTHFYVDLVFYHRILRCFVLIDLKINEVKHTDIGQMNLYLNYFATEENIEGDNPPIGLVLGKSHDRIKTEYALGGITNHLFVSRYKLHLPDQQDLENLIMRYLDKE